MIHFRLRDYFSVLAYRVLARPFFGRFGRDVRVVWPLRIVGAKHCEFADGVTLQYGAYVAVLPSPQSPAPVLRFGAGTMVGNFAHLICTRRIEIGEKVLIADRVYISDNLHDYRDIGRPVMDQPLRQTAVVAIGAGSWIGENVCIVGARIGVHCTIGANSVVTRDIPDHCVAAGAPAVPLRRYCFETARWRRTDAQGGFVE
jgi:acetyltransferase-like isoleucine patch superfamily enzyme